jgi:hypothetical protein
MKTFFHPDYWAEIPEGEFIAGISDEQRENLIQETLRRLGYWELEPAVRRQLDPLIEKARTGEELDRDERTVAFRLDKRRIELTIRMIMRLPPRRVVWLKRFYLSRFPLTQKQWRLGLKLLEGEIQASEFPGALEPPFLKGDRKAERIDNIDTVLHLCELLGVRPSTADEWEKAARGTDGRLYPWGNGWNPGAGIFYPNQTYPSLEIAKRAWEVDAFPKGRSPYGVWGMVGGDKDLVEIPSPQPWIIQGKEVAPRSRQLGGRKLYLDHRGGRLRYKDSSADDAFINYLPAWDEGGTDFLNFRPAVDELPQA